MGINSPVFLEIQPRPESEKEFVAAQRLVLQVSEAVRDTPKTRKTRGAYVVVFGTVGAAVLGKN